MTTHETNLETRLPYVTGDYCGTRIRQAQFRYQPDWRWEYVELLKVGKYEQAERLRKDQSCHTR